MNTAEFKRPPGFAELPSQFQPGDKIGLQMLIDIMEDARDGQITKVSFLQGKVRYDIQIPIYVGVDLGPGQDPSTREPSGYFRIANVDSAFIGTPFNNGFHYNSKRDRESRRKDQGGKLTGPAYTEAQLINFGNYLLEKVGAIEHSIDGAPIGHTRKVMHADLSNWRETNPPMGEPEIKESVHNTFEVGVPHLGSEPPDSTREVLIDLDARKKSYVIGCFDRMQDAWIDQNGRRITADIGYIRWMDLPK